MKSNESPLPFTLPDDIRADLIEMVCHPPNPGEEAALVWSSRLVDLDDIRRKDLELGSGFAVLFYLPGSRSPDSFYDLAPGSRISISEHTLEHLRNKTLHYITRNVTLPTGRTEDVRVLTASDRRL